MSPKERVDWRLLGRTIGTGIGWDDSDMNCFVIYDFIPSEGLALPTGDVYVDLNEGTISLTNVDGTANQSADLVSVLQGKAFEPVVVDQKID